MSSLVISGDTSGTVTLSAPSVAGTATVVLPSGSNTVTIPSGTGTVAVQGVSSNLVQGTAQATTSGTAILFTGIPSWVKRVIVIFQAVGTSGTTPKQVQIGSGSVVSTGYSASYSTINSTSAGGGTSTTGIYLGNSNVAADRINGICTIINLSGNTWSAVFHGGATGSAGDFGLYGSGSITLSGALDRVNITTVNGTDIFAAGSVNIMWE